MENLKPHPADSSPQTPLNFLDRAATIYHDCPSIVYNATTYTWSQTHRRCLQLASSLSSLGIRRGDVVSVLAPNVPATYELHFAVPFSGAVLNTLNTRLDSRTISVLLRHSESKLVFVDVLSVPVLLEALSSLPSPPKLVLIEDEYESTFQFGEHFISTYEKMVESGDANFDWVRPRSEWDPITLNYTSGTTSSPKGVVHCHRGVFVVVLDTLVEWSVPKQPVYLWTLPMFHANGWCLTWGMAAVGGTNICVRKFDAPTIYHLIRDHRVTHMCGAPVVLNMLTNFPDNNKPLEHPVHIMTAAAPPPSSVLYWAESLGFVVSHGYGLTETAGIVLSCGWKKEWDLLPRAERAKLKARQGVRTAGMTAVDVVDESGKSVPRDGSTPGEIVIRGGLLMLGYLKDPEGTSKCLTEDGWFYTGDVAVMHPDGYIEIKDRSKDVIISGGENVSSVEVESVLYSNPAINEAAVVARPDEFWGETPCAFVSLKAGLSEKPSEKDVIEFCRAKLPHYMVPKTVIFKEELPKTSTGKVQKLVLRDIAKALGELQKSRM